MPLLIYRKASPQIKAGLAREAVEQVTGANGMQSGKAYLGLVFEFLDFVRKQSTKFNHFSFVIAINASFNCLIDKI
jgi:hypothetical protein